MTRTFINTYTMYKKCKSGK